MKTKYGIISDVHRYPMIVPVAVDVLKKQGIEKLLVNGDIGNRQKTLQDSQNYIAFILDAIGKSGLEAYVQPGSHESLLAFNPVLEYFSEKYDNIFSINDPVRVENKDHHLVFLPGSDFTAGGEFQIGDNKNIPTETYIRTLEGLIQSSLEDYIKMMSSGGIKGVSVEGILKYNNMNDLREIVINPEKTIVVCHVPRKFDNPNVSVDMAHFHQQRVYHRDFKNNPNNFIFTELAVSPGFISREEIEKKGVKTFGLEDSEDYILKQTMNLMRSEHQEKIVVSVERKENRGNQDLKNLCDDLGITKAISSHFHESGHRANDSEGNFVNQGEYVNNLFWNPGCLDFGQIGILNVDEDKTSYQNIQLKN